MTDSDNDEGISKEQRILRVLRKVLANIVKDATPGPGRPSPFQESTIADIRDLFGLISEREKELAEEAGLSTEARPYYTDQPRKSSVVTLHKPKKDKKLN